MTDKKTLNDEELNKVAGGEEHFFLEEDGFKTIDEVVWSYSIGFTQEICDYNGIFVKRTHKTAITKKGAFYHRGMWYPCYYFQGVPNPEPDVDGWYPEVWINILAVMNCTSKDDRNCGGCQIVER